MSKPTLAAAASAAVIFASGAVHADYNRTLADKAAQIVAASGGTSVTAPLRVLVRVKQKDLKSLLDEGYINARLSAKYPRTGEFYDHLRANKGAPRTLFVREDIELPWAVGLPAAQVASWFLPDLFPKYTFLGIERTDTCPSGLLAPGMRQSKIYGDIWVELDGVLDRTTYTTGDSLDDHLTPAPLSKLTSEQFYFKPKERSNSEPSGMYVEAQIWGPVTGHNITRIWTDDAKVPERVADLAQQYGVPVSQVEITEPLDMKECATVKGSTENSGTRPDVDLKQSLKQAYAEVMSELRAMATRQDSVNTDTWNELLARRVRTLYFFMSRTNGDWSDLRDGVDDELARQDAQLFSMFRMAEREHDKMTFPTGVTATEIAERFYPRGTGWPAFFDEVKFWCKESGDPKAVAAAVAKLPNTRSASTLSFPEAVQTYVDCGGGGDTREYTAKIVSLARRVSSVTPGSALEELRAEVGKVTAALGMPGLTGDIANALVTIAKKEIRDEVKDEQGKTEAATTELARLSEAVKTDCHDFGEDVLAVKKTQSTIDTDWANANRECNKLQLDLENNDPVVSKYTTKDGSLTAWRRDVLPGLKANHPPCIERDRLTKQKEAVSRCITTLESKASAAKKKKDAVERLETLLREFTDVQ